MVTVVITSLAMVALAQLQVNSYSGNQSALYASYAAVHARDISERILANPLGGASLAGVNTAIAHYHINLWDSTLGAASPSNHPECNSLSLTTACTPSARAETDYYQWLQAISSDMPAGTRAQVCVDTNPIVGNQANQIAYSINNLPSCQSSSTIAYTASGTLIQNSFPITYYIHIEYPFFGSTQGLVIPVQVDAYEALQ